MALTLLPWDVGKHVPNEMLPYIHRSWASTALMPKVGLSSFSIRAHSGQKTQKKKHLNILERLEHAQPWAGT